MAVAFFDVAVPRLSNAGSNGDANRADTTTPTTGPDDASASKPPTDQAQRYVQEFFDQLDKNGDGRVDEQEAPLAVRRFSFDSFDHNGDRRVTRDEVEVVADQLYP